jgi:CBS domain-containing protein
MQIPRTPSPAFETFKVRDFMARSVIVVGPHATLDSAHTYFEKHDVDVLPVVDRLRLMGVLTNTDLLRAFSKRSRSAILGARETGQEEVQAFMTPKPKTFSPNDPMRLVLEEMAITRHRSFVVVDNDRVVGVISKEHVLGALRQSARARSAAQVEHSSAPDVGI